MKLQLQTCTVRSWASGDATSLVEHADNRRVWMSLRDRFPHPYTLRHARDFIRSTQAANPERSFAIGVDGLAVGAIGFVPEDDVERVSAEIGYWVGEAYWGRGIATDALKAVTAYALESEHLTRIFALPFADNAGSCRVLEKAGYVLEARLRRSAIKEGRIVDQMQYAFIVP